MSVELDAHYHARNVTSAVYFQRAIELIPSFTLFVEVGSSKSLLGQVTRTRGLHDNDQISTLGLVTVDQRKTESIYLNYNLLRTAMFKAGYIGAFGLHRGQKKSGVNSNMPFESEAAWKLVSKTVKALKGCMEPEFAQKAFTVEDVRRNLDSCVRAEKPREKLVLHSLRRAMCLISQSLNSIIVLRPLLRALSMRDTEAAAVAGGLLLLLEFSPATTMTTWSNKLHVSPWVSSSSEYSSKSLPTTTSGKSSVGKRNGTFLKSSTTPPNSNSPSSGGKKLQFEISLQRSRSDSNESAESSIGTEYKRDRATSV